MHFFYMDESGNTGNDLGTTTEPVHWLISLGASPREVQSLETDMLAVAIKYFQSRAHAADFELHGVDIFSGRGEARGLTPVQRVSLYGEILQLLTRHDIPVWVRGIHKGRHAQRAAEKQYVPEHPYKLGFMYLVESLDAWLANIQPPLAETSAGADPSLGVLVSDEQDDVSRLLVAGFARWRQLGTDHGYKTRPIRYLIDTIHYVKSQDSWLIQLVDCIAYIRNRSEKNLIRSNGDESTFGQSEKAVAELWRQHCAPQVVDSRIWPQ